MFLSIVSPSYNQAKFLPRMLESVSFQKYRNFEHIILDPGSDDGSLDLLKEYAKDQPNVTLIIEPDNGQIDAINKGLARAKGDVIAWINSDDFYFDEFVFEQVVEYFKSNPDIDIVYGRGIRVDENGNKIKNAFVHPAGTDFSVSLASSIGILQPSLFFRRRVYEVSGGLDENWPLQLDYELWIRFAQKGFRFGFLDKYLSRATVHSLAKSTHFRQKQLDECLELMFDKFGYVEDSWIERFAEFFLTQKDSKVVSDIALTANQVLLFDLIKKNVSLKFSQLGNSDIERRAKKYASRYVVTAFDSNYFNQGLNLIASLHRTSFSTVDGIYVYSLGLSDYEIKILSGLAKVKIVHFPENLEESFFSGFLDPKTRAYKCYSMKAPELPLNANDSLLWMDAGLSCLKDIKQVFDIVEAQDFFITDHDESKHWPFFNISFMHEACVDVLKPSVQELMSPHLCSAIVGYKISGKFQYIIDRALEFGRNPKAVLWPKVLPENEKRKSKLNDSESELRKAIIKGEVDVTSQDVSVLKRLFPYYGHRTQSVLSVLVKRECAPVFSSKIFRQGNSASSQASQRNWLSSAKDTDRAVLSDDFEGVSENTVIFHHRGTYNFLDGLRFEGSENKLFVLGNGPSLKGFDFFKLKPYHTLGMNAAYRFWDQTGFYPTYYACFDTVVQESHGDEIRRLIREKEVNGIRKFFLRKTFLDSFPDVANDSAVVFLEDIQANVRFIQRDKITTGSFSVYVGLYLGYRDLYLLGIDLNYVEKLPEARADGKALELIETPKENPNYFFDGYQVKGDRYNPPNRHPGMHLRSWAALKSFLDKFPARVTNLNPSSAVKDFAFSDFASIHKELSYKYRKATDISEKLVASIAEQDFWRGEFLDRLRIFQKYGAIKHEAPAVDPASEVNSSFFDLRFWEAESCGGLSFQEGGVVRCADTKDKDRYIQFVLKPGVDISGRSYFLNFSFVPEKSVVLKVSFSRKGGKDYEGFTKTVNVKAGTIFRFSEGVNFKQSHSQLRVRIDLVSSDAKGDFCFAFDNIFVYQGFSEIFPRLAKHEISIALANKLFEKGEFGCALIIYLYLYGVRGIEMYRNNASLSLKRIGCFADIDSYNFS